MKKIFSFLSAILFAGALMATEVSVTIHASSGDYYAKANGWENGTQYSQVILDDNITANLVGTGNNGKYYSDWRFYTNGSDEGSFSIDAAEGYQLQSVTFEFSVSNSGALYMGETKLTSKTAVDVSGSKAVFQCKNTNSATNGQVKLTKISVTYDVMGVVPPVEDAVYTAVGSSAALFGEAWNPALAANDMTKTAEGYYVWSKKGVALPGGEIEYKVVKDHSWDGEQYPASGNYAFTLPEGASYNVTITLYPGDKAEAVWEKEGDVVIDPTAAVLGQFNNWDETAGTMELSEDKKTASFGVTMPAGDYEFKMFVNGGWLGNGYTFHRDFTGAEGITTNGENMLLKADQEGLYVFTWTFESNALAITFPEKTAPVDPNQMYVWDGRGAKEEDAIEKGGKAEAIEAENKSNIVIGSAQKGNWCWKVNKGFANGANYVGIALDNAVNAGDTVKVAHFRTGDKDCFIGMDFSADKASVSTDYQIISTENPQILSSNGIPNDVIFIVPEGVKDAKYIRVYRNSGSTGLWIAHLAVAKLQGGDVPPVVEDKYYMKNNWDGGEWRWVEMAKFPENTDVYLLKDAVFGGTGVNYNTVASDEGASWVPVDQFGGLAVEANDTADFYLNPKAAEGESPVVTLNVRKPQGDVPPVTEDKYYMKNNWDNGSEWYWKEMEKDDETNYKLANVVFGGTGVNWNTAESDEGANWVELAKIVVPEGITLEAKDTLDFILNPADNVVSARNIRKFIDGGDVPPVVEAEYYLIGTMTNWEVNSAYQFKANPEAEGEYMIVTTLDATDQFKVVGVIDGKQTWYPDGVGNSYGENGELTEGGEYTIFFRPAGEAEGWFHGFILVRKEGDVPPVEDNIWKVTATTAVAAEAIHVDNDLMKLSNAYATTLKENARTIAGVDFEQAIQVRVDAWPTAAEPRGTEKAGSTSLILIAKENIDITLYYNRQVVDGGGTENDNKDVCVYDQEDFSVLTGRFAIDQILEGEKYLNATKRLSLVKGHTYTICAKGTTLQLHGIKYEAGEVPPVDTKYFMKNNWDAGSEWYWKEMEKDSETSYKLANVVFGGTGVNWNTAESDEGQEWVPVTDIVVPEGIALEAKDTLDFILDFAAPAPVVRAQNIRKFVPGGDVPPVEEHTYSVVGPLTPGGWDATSTACDMVLGADGIYRFTLEGVTLATNTSYEYKIVQDHSWAVAFPEQGNATFRVEKSGIYDLAFSLDLNAEVPYAVVPDLKEEIVVIPSVAMHGNFTGGWGDTDDFTVSDDNQSASLKLTLAKGNYEFGMRIGGKNNWMSNGVEFTRENPAAVVEAGSGNLKLAADVEGEYTFTWIFERSTLVITFPEAGPVEDPTVAVIGSMTQWQEAIPFVLSEDKKSAVLTVDKIPAGQYEFKMLINGEYRSNGYRYHRDFPGAAGISENVEANMVLDVDAMGEFTFEWFFENDSLNIIFPEIAPCEFEDGLYLVGSMTNWEMSKEYMLEINSSAAADEFWCEVTLSEGDEFKIIWWTGCQIGAWIPGGEGNNIVVDAAHAGKLRIYVRPAGNEEWPDKYWYIEVLEPENINNTEANTNVVKMLENGQLFIQKGGKTYNVLGTLVK
ncbi:MAG: hypothetical protein IKP02_00250 [Paludibacteraceae bacterium]|nr:hypothetical protein [Paludibacteraceae bacterium]